MITVLNDKAIAVEVPEDAKDFNLWQSQFSLRGRKKGAYVLSFNCHKSPSKDLPIDLPDGNWSILGRPEDMTAEQWNLVRTENTRLSPSVAGAHFLKLKKVNPSSVIILIKE